MRVFVGTLDVKCSKGYYVVVPTTFEPKQESKFMVVVRSDHPVDFELIEDSSSSSYAEESS